MSSRREGKETVEAKYFIASNKYSLQERQTKRGKVYDVMFRIIDPVSLVERQKKISGLATKAKAKEAYLAFVAESCEPVKMKPVRNRDTTKRDPTIDELIQEYISTLPNQNKAASIYSKKLVYRIFVSPFFGDKHPKDLTKEALYKWQDTIWQMKNKRNDGFYGYQYLCNIRALFGTFLSWCESRYGYKNWLPEVVKPKKRAQKTKMQIWTREQFEQFIAVVDDPTMHAFFTLLFYTGRRKGEIFALSPSDVKGRTIVFDKSLSRKTLDGSSYQITTTKADKAHEIPVCATVQRELAAYKGVEGSKFLFGGEKPIANNTLTRYFQYYCKLADVPVIRIHDLRHSFVSMLIHMGANLMVVADLISDTVEQVTKTYGHLYETDKQKIIDGIG